MTDLLKRKCKDEKNPTLLQGDVLLELIQELSEEWKIVNEHHLEKEFHFKNFKEALAYANKIGALAEEEGHHPDLHVSWGKVRVVLWSHTLNGLSETDFILAAKIDQLQ